VLFVLCCECSRITIPCERVLSVRPTPFIQIRLANRFLGRLGYRFNLVLDATECPIERPADNAVQRLHYSGKSKQHALKYELGVHIVRGFIAWLYGSKPGSVHDIEVTRAGGLLRKLLPGELILADKGYVGEDLLLTPIRQPVDENEWNVNRELSSVRIIVEHTIGRIKFFRSMSEPWRHELFFHHFVFRVICNLVNVDMMLAAPR